MMEGKKYRVMCYIVQQLEEEEECKRTKRSRMEII